jgi:hypothetical protein
MKLLYIGDNRVRVNWGCRATSIALKELISENNEIISTINGEQTHHNFDISIIHNISSRFLSKLLNLLYKKSKACRYIYSLLGLRDFISQNLSKTIKNYEKLVKRKNVFLCEIEDKIQMCEAIVINGEGTFIFTTPFRRDALFYLLLIQRAQTYNKKIYLLNAMFSDCPKTGRNENAIYQSANLLRKCDLITVRDKFSLDFAINIMRITSNVEFIPDALFSWTKYLSYVDIILKYPKSLCSFPEIDSLWNNEYIEPYICISGSSYVRTNPQKGVETYISLVRVLKEKFKMHILIVPTCSGDFFLNEVAKKTNVQIVPVTTNILLGFALLANAAVFISGRWHPSILASLGGTPCIFMSSNSHKTLSLQYLLGYKSPNEYSAFPSDEDINGIIDDLHDILRQGAQFRELIKQKVYSLSQASLNHKI